MNIRFVLLAGRGKAAPQGLANASVARGAKRLGKTILCTFFVALSALSLNAQAVFPDKPIRIVTAHPPGGITDVITRAIGRSMESRLGQPIIVEHKPGGKQIIAASYVVKAAPDGYTLLLGSLTAIIMNPIMNPTNLPYHVERDLVPVTRLFDAQLLLITSTPAKTVAEFVDYLKANPGKANYASFGLGSLLQVEAELFLKEAGATATEIPFGGSAPSLNALLSGSVQFMFDAGISSIPHVKAGKLNLLAQTGATRDPTLPDTPTMAEAGFPAAEVVSWWGILAPAKTPRAIVDRLNKEFELATKDPAVVKLLRQNGIEPRHTTPEGFSKFIKQEDERVKNIIRTTGLKLH